MRKCRGCICWTCLKICCSKDGCRGKRTECGGYNTFEQLGIFKTPPEPEHKPAPRKSWEEYGLGDKEYRDKLMEMVKSPEYAEIVRN